MRLDWPLQVNDSDLDFIAPWCQVRWMRDSLSPMPLPVGAVNNGHQETALKHIQALHAFADRDLQGLIISHGIMPVHVSKLLHGRFCTSKLSDRNCRLELGRFLR